MQWTSALAIYFLFWMFSIFLVLPFGVRTTEEAGGDRVAGQADSAPHEFRWWRMAGWTTIVATVLFALFYLNYVFGWIGPQDIDLFSVREP